MYAIVCDKCGKTAVVADHKSRIDEYRENGFFRVCLDNPFESKLDLCSECAEKILGLVRGEEG